ncbi:MAG: hypothetical protein JSS87_03705 [Acidobacteria bacterium]|nr:hypothetical protein [Acidobacteriota bacterium]
MKHPQVFLDCDGVLADFDAAAIELFGLPPREAEAKLGRPAFWNRLRRHKPGFYEHLPLMRDAEALFRAVEHLKPIILTGCPIGNWAQPQKQAWAAKHFPGTQMITCMARDKRKHMQPGDILIDDNDKYRALWEEAGGHFIHHTSTEKTLNELEGLGIQVHRSKH